MTSAEDRPDLRLLPPAAATWGAALLAFRLPPRASLLLALGGCVLGLGLLARRRSVRGRVLAAALLCGAGALAATGTRVDGLGQGPVPGLAAQRAAARVEAVVTGDPRPRPARVVGSALRAGGVVVPARLARVESRGAAYAVRTPVVVLAQGQGWSELLPGQRVVLDGRLAPADRGEVAALLTARGPPELLGAPGLTQRAAGRLRAGLRDAVVGLPDKPRGLVPGLVVGDTSRLPPELEEDFRTAGLTHLTAVSGANCAIVVGFVLVVGRRLGLPRRVAPYAAALALAGFVVLARPQPSVLRAAAMGALALAALATGRRRAGLPALCAAVLVLVLADPGLARSYGFALSVLATGGILLLAPAWSARLARHVPRLAAQALAVPLAAQVACAPVVVLLSAQVSLVAVPANLLVAPAVAPATVLGVLAAVAAPLSGALAGIFGRLAGLPAAGIVAVAETAARVPHAAVSWVPGLPGAALLAAVCAGGVLVLPRVLRRRRPAAALLAVALCVALPARARPGWPPPGWVLVACDVGQGDALVLDAGPGTAVVVDAGPDPRSVDRCLRNLGVTRVPLLLLTHLHADHVEGVPGVLRGRAVAALGLSAVQEPVEEAERVRGWAEAAGVPVRSAEPGQRQQVGEDSGALRWEVLWPRRVIRGEGSVPNNASVVVLAERSGVRMLLTGDVEPPAQRALLPGLADGQLPVDVLKVPHHGSAHQEPGLVARARPRVAVVSVGVDNGYGHPAPGTLASLQAAGARVLRTDEQGDVAVVGPVDRLRTVSRGR